MSFLIRELTEEVHYLTEEIEGSGKKQLFIEGNFLMGNRPNRNRRIYPTNLLEREVERYSRDFISRNRAYGELDHPKGNSINLDRVSHMITELRKDGDNFVGKAKIIETTPMGAIAKGIIESGGTLAVSSRGAGSMKRNSQGIMEVQEDFFLSTAADIVADPSAPIAFVNSIAEGYDWVFDLVENKLVSPEQLDTTRNIVVTEWKSMDMDKALKLFENFVNTAVGKK